MKKNLILICLLSFCFTKYIKAQQDPQYTQYMHNTVSINPAYAGSKGHTVITAIGRTQWVGFEGAPQTQNLSYDTSIPYTGLGLAFNLTNDEIGPSSEIYLDGNVSYNIETGEEGNLAFGLRLGGRFLSIDWTKGTQIDPNDTSFAPIDNRFLPTVGAGIYYYQPEWYFGVSVPNFLRTEHYDAENALGEVAVERLHFFFIAGYVYNINEDLKFKPAALLKAVSGAPVSLDVSANFLFQEKFRAGLSWRWGDAISGLLGFQATDELLIGYSYDLTTSNYNVANSGTHEIMLRYEVLRDVKYRSPRFF